jgi:hypothetical protein
MVREARLSDDRRYRYTLFRRWGERPSGVTWIMLNPSTADAAVDDPTIRRCMVFSQRFGYDAMLVVNLFAYRTTDPDEILEVGPEAAIGPENGEWCQKACHQAAVIVAAWGALRKPLRGAASAISKIIQKDGYRLKCLGKTKDGQPRHPLYIRANAPLVDWVAA